MKSPVSSISFPSLATSDRSNDSESLCEPDDSPFIAILLFLPKSYGNSLNSQSKRFAFLKTSFAIKYELSTVQQSVQQ
jgi:hypothetical protein